jgi:hypothetical protein
MACNVVSSEESEDEQYDSLEVPSTERVTHPHNTQQRKQATSLGGPELLRSKSMEATSLVPECNTPAR